MFSFGYGLPGTDGHDVALRPLPRAAPLHDAFKCRLWCHGREPVLTPLPTVTIWVSGGLLVTLEVTYH
jgi:hypothetical protein